MMRILGTINPGQRGRVCQLALVSAAVVALLSADAQAYSYGSWGSAGSYGSYGSGGSWGSGGSYGSYGRVGILGRMAARRQARRAARASYGSYGSAGSYASYGSYGSYATVSYAPVVSYGSAGSYGSTSYSVPVEYSAPVEYSTPVDTGCDCAMNTTSDANMLAEGSAAIQVNLPADAKVFVNDAPTTSTGSSRNYVSNGLEKGQTYAYKLRVEFDKDGETVVRNKTVRLQAGTKVALRFEVSNSELQLGSAQSVAKTELKVTVPEGARVLLAGSPTQQTGTERTYTTHALATGQEWEGYVVRVEFDKDGEQLVQERTLKIEGGEAYELAFDFDADSEANDALQVAQLD